MIEVLPKEGESYIEAAELVKMAETAKIDEGESLICALIDKGGHLTLTGRCKPDTLKFLGLKFIEFAAEYRQKAATKEAEE